MKFAWMVTSTKKGPRLMNGVYRTAGEAWDALATFADRHGDEHFEYTMIRIELTPITCTRDGKLR